MAYLILVTREIGVLRKSLVVLLATVAVFPALRSAVHAVPHDEMKKIRGGEGRGGCLLQHACE